MWNLIGDYISMLANLYLINHMALSQLLRHLSNPRNKPFLLKALFNCQFLHPFPWKLLQSAKVTYRSRWHVYSRYILEHKSWPNCSLYIWLEALRAVRSHHSSLSLQILFVPDLILANFFEATSESARFFVPKLVCQILQEQYVLTTLLSLQILFFPF